MPISLRARLHTSSVTVEGRVYEEWVVEEGDRQGGGLSPGSEVELRVPSVGTSGASVPGSGLQVMPADNSSRLRSHATVREGEVGEVIFIGREVVKYKLKVRGSQAARMHVTVRVPIVQVRLGVWLSLLHWYAFGASSVWCRGFCDEDIMLRLNVGSEEQPGSG